MSAKITPQQESQPKPITIPVSEILNQAKKNDVIPLAMQNQIIGSESSNAAPTKKFTRSSNVLIDSVSFVKYSPKPTKAGKISSGSNLQNSNASTPNNTTCGTNISSDAAVQAGQKEEKNPLVPGENEAPEASLSEEKKEKDVVVLDSEENEETGAVSEKPKRGRKRGRRRKTAKVSTEVVRKKDKIRKLIKEIEDKVTLENHGEVLTENTNKENTNNTNGSNNINDSNDVNHPTVLNNVASNSSNLNDSSVNEMNSDNKENKEAEAPQTPNQITLNAPNYSQMKLRENRQAAQKVFPKYTTTIKRTLPLRRHETRLRVGGHSLRITLPKLPNFSLEMKDTITKLVSKHIKSFAGDLIENLYKFSNELKSGNTFDLGKSVNLSDDHEEVELSKSANLAPETPTLKPKQLTPQIKKSTGPQKSAEETAPKPQRAIKTKKMVRLGRRRKAPLKTQSTVPISEPIQIEEELEETLEEGTGTNLNVSSRDERTSDVAVVGRVGRRGRARKTAVTRGAKGVRRGGFGRRRAKCSQDLGGSEIEVVEL